MTVSELIEELKKLPPGDPVVINMDRNELANSKAVGKVQCLPALGYSKDGTYSAAAYDLYTDAECDEYGYVRTRVVNLTPS